MKVAEHINSSTLVKDLGKCGVCSVVWTNNDLVNIPNFSKGFGIYACPDCKLAFDKALLVKRIKIVKSKYAEINWFSYREGVKRIEGHSFIFSNGDVISLYHNQGDVTLDQIIQCVQSSDYENNIYFDIEARRSYYRNSKTPYPIDPFTATDWW